ncbi:Cysteine protease, C1A family [Flexibacter flexilis DSM 6793]|uniref:Cysteine protease, C1A family n=1 Tax=Flexibacter flexilis DSM 6793 TaxID=927664 RepID=A0A1I1FVF9_9BACT|nr:C1 family peptidase [Flexibacter flexilis]SFC03305.1 Cysteine protease, C1A family [Flexibacter flexilis DSM 6793]
MNKLTRFGYTLAIALSLSSCDEETTNNLKDAAQSLGLNFTSTDTTNIESDLYLGAQAGSGSLPASVDLTSKFPPINDQGQYGTCVAWAAGYNMKTFLEGVDKGLTTSQLANTNNQFSPKDLFLAIPSDDKGSGCNGTYFEAALDLMISRGIATLGSVPYADINCSSSASSSVQTFKIKNYRQIKHNSISELKSYLAGGRAVLFGAKLGNKFMSWEGNSVIKSDPVPNNGQHGYHAMVLAGYDDSRNAFRVVNSWGTEWGDNGYIWVDYTYFTTDFAYAAYVVSNEKTDFNPDGGGGNVNPDVIVNNNIDLISWSLTDEKNTSVSSGRGRNITYNVYNLGTNAIPASKKWNIVYCIYDAYDANNFEVLLYDYYTNEYGTLGQNGDMSSLSGSPHRPGTSGNWWNYVNIAGGKSATGSDEPFSWGYTMPNVTGDYYLVLISDGYDVLKEADEDNNYLFVTADGSTEPIHLENGVVTSGITGGRLAAPAAALPKAVHALNRAKNPNTYTPQELMQVIQYQKKAGILEAKIKQYNAAQKTKKVAY